MDWKEEPLFFMLRFSPMLLLLALISLALGVWALVGVAALVARLLVGLFLALFIVSLVFRAKSKHDDSAGP